MTSKVKGTQMKSVFILPMGTGWMVYDEVGGYKLCETPMEVIMARRMFLRVAVIDVQKNMDLQAHNPALTRHYSTNDYDKRDDRHKNYTTMRGRFDLLNSSLPIHNQFR